MKSPTLAAILVWSALAPSQACGPFFADTLLDSPQSALQPPPVSFLADLYRMAGKPMPGDSARGQNDGSLLRQIPLETAELRSLWEAAGVDAAEIDRRATHYQAVRTELLKPLDIVERMNFPTQEKTPPNLPERPLGNDFPPDVADYVEAARLQALGKTAEARTIWKSILDRPPTEKKLRAVWAAWMLAKTAADINESTAWYERVEREAKLGATDVINLRASAKSWRASKLTDPNAAIHLLFESFSEGKESAAIELRWRIGEILRDKQAEVLAAAATDPLVRHLINLNLHASLDSSMEIENDEVRDNLLPNDWLAAVEVHAAKPIDDGPRLAWALYAVGRFDESRRWLALSDPADPRGMWLQAKFDLRNGDLNSANQNLAGALRQLSQAPDWQPENTIGESDWWSDASEVRSKNQSRLLGDVGIVSIAREDYLAALESLRHGGYREDAVYLAECVISTDALMKHVRSVAPAWTPEGSEEKQAAIDPTNPFSTDAQFPSETLGPDNQLRYLLARRLARENRFQEAREFMPPQLLPVFAHYSALDQAQKSGLYSGEALAAILWQKALIHRHLGAQLFSTDGPPDAGVHGWSFRATSFATIRAFQNGWYRDWELDPMFGPAEKPEDKAVPHIGDDEISRTKQYALPPEPRFHYRYAAADLAWQAAKSLPANHPLLARLYNTAGQWLSNDDPKAADRFYQAIVRRCAKTPEGQAADSKRWFLPNLEPLGDLPALPEALRSTRPL